MMRPKFGGMESLVWTARRLALTTRTPRLGLAIDGGGGRHLLQLVDFTLLFTVHNIRHQATCVTADCVVACVEFVFVHFMLASILARIRHLHDYWEIGPSKKTLR